MSRWHAYLNAGKQIIDQYEGRVPLSVWLKQYFAQNKKAGSKDRKIISELVYCYFRLGHAVRDMPVKERMLTGLFLCNSHSVDILKHLKPEWNNAIQEKHDVKVEILNQASGNSPVLDESLKSLNYSAQLDSIFPWKDSLSRGLDDRVFNQSMLQKPDLFLRIRPGNHKKVRKKLQDGGVPFREIDNTCFALPNSTGVDTIFEVDKEVVVQDYSSQQVGSFYNPLAETVWDCCAASGGKSIMAYDRNPGIQLTVTDVRQSILHNLSQRFKTVGIISYNSFVTDLTRSDSRLPPGKFRLIIADVPCSGSGTWARTPEQLYFFDAERIDHYSYLQRKIVSRIIPLLSDGGHLVYSTCSVFRKENEDIADFITQQFPLHLVRMEVLKGYHLKADSMFVAVFEK